MDTIDSEKKVSSLASSKSLLLSYYHIIMNIIIIILVINSLYMQLTNKQINHFYYCLIGEWSE